MNAKDKAIELVDKFYNLSDWAIENEDAKQCALICVDEILETTKKPKIKYALVGSTKSITQTNKREFTYSKYWQEVKKEIEKL